MDAIFFFFNWKGETGEFLKDLIRHISQYCQLLWKTLGFNKNQDKTEALRIKSSKGDKQPKDQAIRYAQCNVYIGVHMCEGQDERAT